MGQYKDAYLDYKKSLAIEPGFSLAAARMGDFIVTSQLHSPPPRVGSSITPSGSITPRPEIEPGKHRRRQASQTRRTPVSLPSAFWVVIIGDYGT